MTINKQSNKWLIFSVILNLILVCLISFGAYYNRQALSSSLDRYFPKANDNIPTRAGGNLEFYKSEINIINKDIYPKAIKILILGNSISVHPISSALKWNHVSGMAASSIDNDYVHILLNRLSRTKKYEIRYMVVNISEFEKSFKNFDYNRLNEIITFHPDIAIFQLGENVSKKDIIKNGKKFAQKYIKLIHYCNADKNVVCLPFWPQKEKLSIITDIAIRTDAYLVDLSHLGSGIEPLNFAKSENKYEIPLVVAHPGNYGMKNIANVLYATLNKIIE